MTPDQLHDLRRQAVEFERAGGYQQPHNRAAGADRAGRQLRHRRARRRQRQIAKAVQQRL